MKIAKYYPLLEQYLMSLGGVEKDFKEEWGWTRFMLRGKMFCAFCGESGDFTLITVKCEPEFNTHIRELYEGKIIEGYYMNKVHWNSVYPDKGVPYELIKEMCDRGYRLVLRSLPKKTQREITGENDTSKTKG